MWINSDVNLPERLIEAQSSGKLVIFAGAGVSMGPPSNLPDFGALGDQIAAGATQRLKDEPIDRFLGRVSDLGVDTQCRTRTIIGNPESKPKRLHRNLLELFASGKQIRLITTNFDRHFSTSAYDLFGEGFETYHAPALPLGRDFTGIVYLHGSLEKARHPLVLTDGDFGRAYLTEGWATRLLMDVFQNFVVLFVGYSHDDPVMHYLARSLASKSDRFIFSSPGQETKWSFLGITLVHFPLQDGSNPYGALEQAIQAWVTRSKMGALDHERRIRELVAVHPPIERDANDYLAAAVQNEVTLRFFVNHARSIDWLRWAEGAGLFDSLFKPEGLKESCFKLIAHWFADRFVLNHAAEGLLLVQRHGPIINVVLWDAIARALARCNPRPDTEVLTKWVVVLYASYQPGYPTPALESLLKKSDKAMDAAILLLRRLARPVAILEKERIAYDHEPTKPRISVDIALTGKRRAIQESWNALFRSNLGSIRDQVRWMLSDYVSEAYFFLRASGESGYDSLSRLRPAIEPHSQNFVTRDFDFLIDAARDLMEYLLANHPDEADSLIMEWSRADAALLRRLAIHGMAENSRLCADVALDAVVSNRWLYGDYLKHEVFRLIQMKYPFATQNARQRLIEYSMTESVLEKSEADEEARRISDNERYNVAVWLNRVAEDCPVAMHHLQLLQARHPDFRPREHPDFDSWIGEVHFGATKGPLGAEDLLEKNPGDLLDLLHTLQEDTQDYWGGARQGLMETVKNAVAQRFAWGWELASALQIQKRWDRDLWRAIVTGWREATIEPNQWKKILNLILETPEIDSLVASEIADLLERAVDYKTGSNMADQVRAAELIADRLYGGEDLDDGIEPGGRHDWLSLAINHFAGRVTIVWLRALSHHRSAAGVNWEGLPTEYRERFEQIITGKTVKSQRARTVLASQLHLVFDADPVWTKSEVLTLFDWEEDPVHAEQSWNGYLSWGRWNEPLFRELLPFLKQSFSKLDGALSGERNRLCDRIAVVALQSLEDPWHDGWLREFIRDAGEESRKIWAARIGQAAGGLSAEAVSGVWNRWIGDYWSDRLTGIPRPLSDGERAEMVGWCLGFRAVFREVVEKICRGPAPLSENDQFFFRLRESDLATSEPVLVACLVRHILTELPELSFEGDDVDHVVRTLIEGNAPRNELKPICESMARLGWPRASELLSMIPTPLEGSAGA